MDHRERRRTMLLQVKSLSEIEDLMKELKQMGSNLMARGQSGRKTGDAETLEPGSLLDISDMNPPIKDEMLGNDCKDLAYLALPGRLGSLKEYPSDFTVDCLDAHLRQVQHNLIEFVRRVRHEEAMGRVRDCLDKRALETMNKLKHPVSPAPAVVRKNSYVIRPGHMDTIEFRGETAKLYGIESDGVQSPEGPTMVLADGLEVNLPVIPDGSRTITKSKILPTGKFPSKSNGTYSKQSSPFAISSPRIHPATAFPTSNGNLSDEESATGNSSYPTPPHVNINVSHVNSRTITRPSRLPTFPLRITGANMNPAVVSSAEDSGLTPSAHSGGSSGSMSHISSMEELHSLARQQEESLFAGASARMIQRKGTQVLSERSSLDDEEGSGSTDNRTWSHDTYSVGKSNTASTTSSGISSPPAAQSYEDIQMDSESLRRSMPNLTPKTLAMAPTLSRGQMSARYNSDVELEHSQSPYRPESQQERRYMPKTNPNIAPLKKALTRGDTFQLEEEAQRHVNGNDDYQKHSVRPSSFLKQPNAVSGIRTRLSYPLTTRQSTQSGDGEGNTNDFEDTRLYGYPSGRTSLPISKVPLGSGLPIPQLRRGNNTSTTSRPTRTSLIPAPGQQHRRQ